MPKEFVVWGPPGTGKTTYSTGLAKDWVSRGTHPSQIAYLAFTKAAAKAAAFKILDSEDDAKVKEEFPLFRTIHSLCYQGLRKAKPDHKLMNVAYMKAFSKWAGMEGSYGVFEWEDLADVYRKMQDQGRSEWDKALAAYTLSRSMASSVGELQAARLQPNDRASEMLGPDLMDYYETFVKKYEDFKRIEGLIDFTDMIEFGMTEMEPVDCKYVILDECQDLAPGHHFLVDRLLSNSEEIWWVGDDDQSIFKFSGASAELFLDRAKRASGQVQLVDTHRFGQDTVEFSKKIIARVTNRHIKEVKGLPGRPGVIGMSGEFKPVHGDLLVLHRHVKGCQFAAQAYIEAGIPFRNERGKDPLGSPSQIKAWHAVNDLSRGKAVMLNQAAVMIDELLKSYVKGERGETVWLVPKGAKSRMDDLSNAPVDLHDLISAKLLTTEGAQVVSEKEFHTMKHQDNMEYYERLSKNNFEVEDSEKIARIVTIHGSKGREADSVIIFNEMTSKCWNDPDTEHRLAYVAATRSRGDVTVCFDKKLDYARDEYSYPFSE
jgi:superfamily I DNA/RNA helicase